MSRGALTALILAGKRDGAIDALAAAAGVTHKCLVPIAGRPLIAHVLEALGDAPQVSEIIVSVDAASTIAHLPEVQRLAAEGRLRIVEARRNLVDSIVDALRNASFPAVVTTADNVLLTPQAIADVARLPHDADARVAMVRRDDVLAAHPEGQRRFYRFRGHEYSNCNLYWIGNRRAIEAAEIFRGGGQFAKHPARIVAAFGLFNLLRFRLGWDSIGTAFARISRRFGLTLQPSLMSDGALAIDVDNERTHRVAATLLAERDRQLKAAA